MRLVRLFRRWRASRGFGIHSPGAFLIIKRVIRPPKGTVFYGEENLSLRDAPVSQIRRSRLLLRFVAERHAATVWVSPGLSEIYLEAIRLAGCVLRIYDGAVYPTEIGNVDLVVTDGYRIKKRDLVKCLSPGKSLIGFNLSPSFLKTIRTSLKGGWLLDGIDGVIAVATNDPEVHNYEISRF